MKTRQNPNPKKRLRPLPNSSHEKESLVELAQTVRYVGNPDHKRNPGDYGLEPPSRHRLAKSLCDAIGIFSRSEAQDLLCEGIIKCCIDIQEENGWPRVVWAVLGDSVLEARLDNRLQGTYHGYPLGSEDPFAPAVLKRWNLQ